jgi:hypothetical protein
MSEGNTGPVVVADPTARAAMEKVLNRDRRLVRAITAGTVVLWVLVLASVVLLLRTYFFAIVPKANALMRAANEGDSRLDQGTTVFAKALSMGVAITVGTVGLLSLATLGTVALVFASRRATLRQINLSLLDISNQLRELQRSAGAPPTGPPPS